MKDPYQIIKQPLITEKSTILRESDKYAFVVDVKAGKVEIRKAAEELFDLKGKILKINTMQIRGKSKGQFLRHRRGRRPNWKKAVITVTEGTTIQIFEGI
ncbi:MAG: 50S ribosomal protein L23 [Candidatus Poribacteria bacterium]|nr:50S ribosomal protein L23 [Candidatus Poribacteria bacterium]